MENDNLKCKISYTKNYFALEEFLTLHCHFDF